MSKGDVFLKLKSRRAGVLKGESVDSSHKDEIDVLSIAWGMQGALAIGSDGTANKTTLDNLRITKAVDRSSTGLMSILRTNDPIVEALITVRKSGGANPLDYFQIKITNGRITTYQLQTDAVQPDRLIEVLELNFKAIEVQYKLQDDKGASGGATMFSAESV
jgi:type VI secretion system secreted protein Hcp